MNQVTNGVSELMVDELDAITGGGMISDAAETVMDGIDTLLGGSKTVEALQNKINPYWRRT